MRNLLFFLLASSLFAAAQKPAATTPPSTKQDKPLQALPYSPSLDVTSMDKSIDPCADFYTYSCGGWTKKNPIPADQSSWSVYGKLYNDNQQFLWGILDDLAKNKSGRDANQQKIGDYFGACMDEAAVEKLGATPLKPQLDAIAGLQSKKDLAPFLAKAQMQNQTSGLLFNFGSNQDFANSNDVIAFADDGGLGLPDRDYYVKTDAKSVEQRRQYVEHVTRMFQLLGDSPATAQAEAAKVMEIETELAKATLTLVDKRDPYKLFHKMDRTKLQALTPDFDWNVYLSTVGLPDVQVFNVTEPDFYKEVNKLIGTVDLNDWKTYLRWQIVHANAAYLSSNFVNENFAFYGKTLRGAEQLRPRWKRCVSLVDQQLGEALGQEFVRRAFTPEMKKSTVEMTQYIEAAMKQDLETLTWMSPETKQHALEKLHAIVNKVGYPNKWRDYGSVEITPDDFLGNETRATVFESKRQLAKIGKPVDRDEWGMSPPTVNAYYNPQMNDINFPAGVLEPPLYDPKMDDAPNYGNTGSTIGHELTHGFDDEGRQFDAQGNLKDWWTEKDADEFKKRAQCVVDQYGQYTVVDDLKINSKLTEGEDVADLGGTILAYMAWKAATKDKHLQDEQGFTPDQRFFIGFAQWACENERPENERLHVLTDPHSPGKYRINGVVVNMPEFQKAFSCKAGQPMVKAERCRVW